jgi:hypothetical protein
MDANFFRFWQHGDEELLFRPNDHLFEVGRIYPPQEDLERLARYEKGRRLYNGAHNLLYQRAQTMLKDTPHADKLKSLYIACNLVDIIVHKPADLMYTDYPSYETGKDAHSTEQLALNDLVEDNDLNLLGQQVVVGAGIRGDSFIKTYFNYREDYSQVPAVPNGVEREAIIESVDASYVFPEQSRGSRKKFRAVNIAYIEWVQYPTIGKETPYLNVERHVAGFIQYRRFRLNPAYVVTNKYGVPQSQFEIVEEVPTERDGADLVETGVPQILVHHIPHKSHDETWQGVSATERIENLILTINDRLTQIDYILLKHSDPTAYGVDLENAEMNFGGRYIPVRKDEVAPAFMTWDGHLSDAFKQLDVLINLVFQISETPQWLFGTTTGGGTSNGGTSHSDGTAIKARFMPILSKVKRIRTQVDRAMRDALYCAQQLENFANAENPDFVKYEAVYPKIRWRDGIPANEKELAELMQIRTGGRPTIDQHTAIKTMDSLDDEQTQEIIDRIKEDQQQDALAQPSIFNGTPDDHGTIATNSSVKVSGVNPISSEPKTTDGGNPIADPNIGMVSPNASSDKAYSRSLSAGNAATGKGYEY